MRFSYLILPAVLLLCAACRPRTPFHRYLPVPTEGWDRTDTLRFDFVPRDTGGVFRTSLGLRFTEAMPYQDLWLVVERRIAHHRDVRAHRDTLHVPLGTDRGRWTVEGSVLHETEVRADTFSLTRTQPVSFLVYHVMSRQSLPGVTEVGVKVERITENRY